MALTFAGKVDFTVRGKLAPHRFEVSVTDENKSVIWLEDCQSKKQWQTNALETKDFIADKNIIPQASNVDYAERFATCLRSMDAVKFKRTLSSKGNERILMLAFQLPWISPELVVEYEFVLFEVPLERIDILGARVRDVEEKVADVAESRLAVLTDEHGALKADSQRLEQRVGELEKKVFSTPLYARATTQRNHNTNETLVWVGS